MADETYRAGGDRQFEASPDAMKIDGNIPPAFRQALQAKSQERERLKVQGQPTAVPPQQVAPQQGMRLQGSSELESLIKGLKRGTYQEKILPSRGLFYDGQDGPTDGILHMRAMTGEEEQILATPRYVRKGIAINMIFERCLQEQQYRTEKFLSIDRTFLLIWLRGTSYGTNYEVEVKCPECERKQPAAIDLDALVVNDCPADFCPPLTGILPASGYKFAYRLSRGKDESVIQEYRERRVKEFGEGVVDDSLLHRTALLVDDIEGLTDKRELTTLLKVLSIQDVSYLRNLILDPPFGVDTKCQLACQYCYSDFEVEMPLEANFFFPRRQRKKAQN